MPPEERPFPGNHFKTLDRLRHAGGSGFHWKHIWFLIRQIPHRLRGQTARKSKAVICQDSELDSHTSVDGPAAPARASGSRWGSGWHRHPSSSGGLRADPGILIHPSIHLSDLHQQLNNECRFRAGIKNQTASSLLLSVAVVTECNFSA